MILLTNKKVFVWDSLFDPLGTTVIGATYVITIIYGGLLVTNKVLSIGQLVSLLPILPTWFGRCLHWLFVQYFGKR